MGQSVFPAPSAASKTMYRTTLTSGTSWTVPTGVTYVNVTLYGGGSGAGGNSNARGGDGGTTTFTGATSAAGGNGGPSASGSWSYAGSYGLTGKAGTGSNNNYTGAGGTDGAIISSTLSTTPGASITYAIGAGGAGGGSGAAAGGAGGNGKIDIEYWV